MTFWQWSLPTWAQGLVYSDILYIEEPCLGPGQEGGVGDVELVPLLLEGRAARRRLVLAHLAQISVVPDDERKWVMILYSTSCDYVWLLGHILKSYCVYCILDQKHVGKIWRKEKCDRIDSSFGRSNDSPALQKFHVELSWSRINC